MTGNWGKKRRAAHQYVFIVVIVGDALGFALDCSRRGRSLRNVSVDIFDGLYIVPGEKEKPCRWLNCTSKA